MINIRKANERGQANHGWLETKHTFSFASYQDPSQMGFRSLRVINEDRVSPGKGFGMHAHRNMEIVSYVLEGTLAHNDSMGNQGVLLPGEFQRISAGSGIKHSEFNPSSADPVHFYQIWILPDLKDTSPSYEQKSFRDAEWGSKLRLVASPEGDEGSLRIRQDVRIYLAKMDANDSISFSIPAERHVWLQVLRGSLKLNRHAMAAGDGAAISAETSLDISTEPGAEVMLFDLA